ncbi:hypothetical protein UCREL1_10868 [Eutypa lata UCREL1]|uniref:Uncharacterized protein n=1 Tax=Eutypa lata (strain UCR-EL1) TaxID=1287681 RepID=M7SXB1_EUTLA|nr:hypothetical protein UCREL1_10868 [Eutypa lata UCREL1]
MLLVQRPPLRALLLAAILATSSSATYIRSNLVFQRADCCPYGYSCEDGSCTMNKDQSKKPEGAAASPSPSSTKSPQTSSSSSPSSASSSKPTSTASKGEVGTVEPTPGEDTHPASASFPTSTVVGGVVGGIAALIGITVLLMLFRYKRQQAAKKRHDSTSSFGNIISAPQPITGFANQRQDFLAKATSTSSAATTPTTNQTQERFHNNHYHHNQYSPPFLSPQQPYSSRNEMTEQATLSPRSHHPSAEIGGLGSGLGLRDLTSYNRYSGGSGSGSGGGFSLGVPPMTPRGRRKHSGGSESINIFADPSTVGDYSGVRDTTYTTWTNIMADGEKTPGLPDTPTRRR